MIVLPDRSIRVAPAGALTAEGATDRLDTAVADDNGRVLARAHARSHRSHGRRSIRPCRWSAPARAAAAKKSPRLSDQREKRRQRERRQKHDSWRDLLILQSAASGDSCEVRPGDRFSVDRHDLRHVQLQLLSDFEEARHVPSGRGRQRLDPCPPGRLRSGTSPSGRYAISMPSAC